MKRGSRILQACVVLATMASFVVSLPTQSIPNMTMTQDHSHQDPMLLTARDAFTDLRGTVGDARVTNIGRRPGGAYARTLPIPGSSSTIFTWYSKTPHNEADAESAFIVLHGINRDANHYFHTLNDAYRSARNEQIGSAVGNAIRVAPLFFSTNEDRGAYNATDLAWADSNAYTAGEASTHPDNSKISSFAVLDMFIDRFSNAAMYPRMKTITFVGHGGGAQMLQRYAIVGKENPAAGRISLRYVIGDLSSMLYFTEDRPVAVNTKNCPKWNTYRYGVENYSANYGSLSHNNAAPLYKRYASRDVRYVVGLDDTDQIEGDQLCMARAVGGSKRRDRSLAYWKYLHLLGGDSGLNFRNFPGKFPALDPVFEKTDRKDIPRISGKHLKHFRGTRVTHTLTLVSGAGHNARQIFDSRLGRMAIFGDQNQAGGGNMPDFSRELDNVTVA